MEMHLAGSRASVPLQIPSLLTPFARRNDKGVEWAVAFLHCIRPCYSSSPDREVCDERTSVRFPELLMSLSFRRQAQRRRRNLERLTPMSREKRYHVYIMASVSGVLYVGVTGFLFARVLQHKSGETDGFTRRYRVHKLVYYETFRYVNNALARETEIKKWRREKKVAFIEAQNPTWKDLAADWGKRLSCAPRFLLPPLRSASE